MDVTETCCDKSTSSTEWLWGIEYLGSFPQIDPSILHDLIDAAPELAENLGKNARERVALKCLEHLFTGNNGNEVDCASKCTFDAFVSCENALQSILKETSVHELKMAGPDLFKWDFRPFIFQKRASMPKCALQQLKDAILEGTHPCAASLREPSGLLHHDEDDGTDYETYYSSESDIQIRAPEGSTIHFPLQINNMMALKDSQEESVLPFKRNGNHLDYEHSVGIYQKGQGGVDNHAPSSNTKRLKHGGQILIPQSGNESVKNSPVIGVGVAEKGSCHVERGAQEGLGAYRSSENGCDKFLTTERPRASCTAEINNDLKHNECIIMNSTDKIPEGISENKVHQCAFGDKVVENGPSSLTDYVDNYGYGRQLKTTNVPPSELPEVITVEKSVCGMENPFQERTLSDSCRYNHEKVDVAMEKNQFLISQCTLDHVSLSNWTELSLCVKCCKDGQLLVCNAIGCPFVVHESCLGFLPRFDEQRNFYCPFCAYSFAISKYLEAKEMATKTRKELAAFIRKRPDKSQVQQLCTYDQDGMDSLYKGNENRDSGKRKSDKTHSKEHAAGHILERKGEKESEEPMLPRDDINATGVEPEVTHGMTRTIPQENENEEMAVDCPSARRFYKQGQTFDGLNCHDCTLMSKDKEIFCSGEREDRGERSKGVLEQQSTEKFVGDGDSNFNENSGSENEEYMVRNRLISLRRRQPRERQYLYPAIPQLRRSKIPWTLKEEEILKEGVKKFSDTSGATIPWKQILEYGSLVFLPARTTVDLKDKWRNICKGSPKRK